MKKLPKIFILILSINVIMMPLFSAKTHALSIDAVGRTWWTVSELLEYKSIIDEEEETLCAGNVDCLTNYRELKLAEEEKFSALTFLQVFQIVPTELNFKTGTIKILLFDENMRVRGFSQEAQKGVVINELVMWIGRNITESLGANKIKKILNNEVANVYPVFGFTREAPIELVKDQEAEYTMWVNLDNLTGQRLDRIGYSTKANYFNASATTSFYGCSTAKNFPNGKCVLNVSAGEFRYVFEEMQEGSPAEDDEVDETPIEEPIEEPTEEPIEEPIEEPTSDIEPISDEPTQNEPTQDEPTEIASAGGTIQSNPESSINPKAPNTGTFASPCVAKTIEFPWWLVGLIALGDAAVLWLFWPRKSKKA